MSNLVKIGLILAVIFIALAIGPWLLFWSIETIAAAAGFTVVIPFTFWTWLAGVVFIMLLRGGTK